MPEETILNKLSNLDRWNPHVATTPSCALTGERERHLPSMINEADGLYVRYEDVVRLLKTL